MLIKMPLLQLNIWRL